MEGRHNKNEGCQKKLIPAIMTAHSRIAVIEENNILIPLRTTIAHRTQKKLILDEFIASTGYARKYAIRLLSHPVKEPGIPIKRTGKR
jgi:hypothetical protein